jgi:thiamine biosynthesis lipoprotein
MTALARRRFIRISAAAAGMPLLWTFGRRAWAGDAVPQLASWRGVALGADAELLVHHSEPAAARRLIERSLTEVRRLERIFSLYQDDSALALLNRRGTLDDPPADLIRLLGESEHFSRLTDGAFDATVQPLWRLYADHFGKSDADPEGPPAAARAAALACVGHDKVRVDADRVRLVSGAAVTLNGIAQGYITDRVAELLLGSGIERALIDMGETRALGDRPSGEPWRVGLEDPAMPERIAETIEVRNLAVASSGGYGTRFDPAGRFNHLFDPKTGASSDRYLGVSVVAPTATVADALSTAFSLLPLDQTEKIVKRLNIRAYFTLPDGSRLRQSA